VLAALLIGLALKQELAVNSVSLVFLNRGAGFGCRLRIMAVAVGLPDQRGGLQLLLPAAALHAGHRRPENVVALFSSWSPR